MFQCMQDHEEYLQAYVQRFLQLRAQAPTVPNEIVIEAMIKGLRPGPTTQYFARKPPQTLEKLLQKMDKYIRADNDFRQRREEAYRYSEMTRGFGGRLHPRHVRTIHNPSSSDDRETIPKGNNTAPNHQGHNKVPSCHQLQEAEGEEALEEDLVISPGDCSACFVAKIRDTQQVRAKSRSKSRRKSLKLKHDRTHRSRSCIPLHAILRISWSMWAINSLWLLLLRQVTPKPPGLSFHHRHHWRLPWLITNSQKGITRLINSMTFKRSPKLAQSTTLYPSRGISTEGGTTLRPKSALIQCIFTLFAFIFSSKKTIQKGLTFSLM
jgi:hypothetical protein